MGRFESEILHQRFRVERLHRHSSEEAAAGRARRATRDEARPAPVAADVAHGSRRVGFRRIRVAVAARLRAWAERLEPAPRRCEPHGA